MTKTPAILILSVLGTQVAAQDASPPPAPQENAQPAQVRRQPVTGLREDAPQDVIIAMIEGAGEMADTYAGRVPARMEGLNPRLDYMMQYADEVVQAILDGYNNPYRNFDGIGPAARAFLDNPELVRAYASSHHLPGHIQASNRPAWSSVAAYFRQAARDGAPRHPAVDEPPSMPWRVRVFGPSSSPLNLRNPANNSGMFFRALDAGRGMAPIPIIAPSAAGPVTVESR